jgi:hypothetical protein
MAQEDLPDVTRMMEEGLGTDFHDARPESSAGWSEEVKKWGRRALFTFFMAASSVGALPKDRIATADEASGKAVAAAADLAKQGSDSGNKDDEKLKQEMKEWALQMIRWAQEGDEGIKKWRNSLDPTLDIFRTDFESELGLAMHFLRPDIYKKLSPNNFDKKSPWGSGGRVAERSGITDELCRFVRMDGDKPMPLFGNKWRHISYHDIAKRPGNPRRIAGSEELFEDAKLSGEAVEQGRAKGGDSYLAASN